MIGFHSIYVYRLQFYGITLALFAFDLLVEWERGINLCLLVQFSLEYDLPTERCELVFLH